MAEEDLTEDELVLAKEHALGLIEDLFSNYMFYDRKNDEDMPEGRIELLVERGILDPEEIVEAFRNEVLDYFGEGTEDEDDGVNELLEETEEQQF